jgi:hypothetical protein
MTTANRAWSTRRRRFNSEGKNDPACSYRDRHLALSPVRHRPAGQPYPDLRPQYDRPVGGPWDWRWVASLRFLAGATAPPADPDGGCGRSNSDALVGCDYGEQLAGQGTP